MGTPFALYDTQGIPIMRGEGARVPTFNDLGISYGDMDSLGIWLAIRRVSEKAIIGMRIDHVFESGGLGRDNRYILILELSVDKLRDFSLKFRDVIEKILQELESEHQAVYKGKDGSSPYVDSSTVETIIRLIDKIPNYTPDILKELGLSHNRLRVHIDGLDYDDPGIGDREAALKVMVEIIQRRPESPLTELVVFSKSSSATYPGVWIEKNARTPEELLSVLEGKFKEVVRKLSECREEKKRWMEDAQKYKSKFEECISDKRYYQSQYEKIKKSKGLALPIAIGAMIALLIGGLIGGAYLQSAGMVPLFGKPAKITPVKDAELNKLLGNASSLPKNSSKVIGNYIEFINTSQRTKSVNFPDMTKIVEQDIILHRQYNKTLGSLTDELEKKNKEIKTLTDTNKNLQSQLTETKNALNNLNKTVVSFESETKYFTLMCGGSNVTLTTEDVKSLGKNPGIDGWLEVMRNHCLAKLKEIQNSTLTRINQKITPLSKGDTSTVVILQEIYQESLSIENISTTKYNAGKDILENFTRFIQAINSSLAEVQGIDEKWVKLEAEVKSTNVSKVKSCQEAYGIREKWKEEFTSLNAETMEKLAKTPAVEIIIALDNLSKANTTYTYDQIKEMKNAPEGVKGLVYYVGNMCSKMGWKNIGPFWELVRKTIVPPQGNSIEDINKSLESLLKLVKELKVRIGGA